MLPRTRLRPGTGE